MGTLADTLFRALMSWVRALVNGIWALFSAEHTPLLAFLGKHWLIIAGVIAAAGLIIDWLVWLIRWQPYQLWAMRMRRFAHGEDEEERGDDVPDEEAASGMLMQTPDETALWEEQAERERIEQLYAHAQAAPDETIYPGMRYADTREEQRYARTEDTQRLAAVHVEGPGAREVERRRAEIDAWQEAAYKAQYGRREEEKPQQTAKVQPVREPEQDTVRIAAESPEQAEYRRKLAEYEQKKEQYEREMAEYRIRKAEYDRQMAQIQAREAYEAGMRQADGEREEAAVPRRRRQERGSAAYTDYVAGETVETLPDAPAWPGMRKDERRSGK